MGGGDLNSKKSWHPSTMKNQERVWKAEQAATEEKKRIQELQREHAEERDRAELNSMIKKSSGSTSAADDNRLHWMYDKPDKKVQQEDYLLGKSIDKNYDQPDKLEDVIPAVARRVVGSSMLPAAGDSQVDLARKLREDPLLLVKERERAARAALLNNPLQRRRLAELLRKEQDQRKEAKSKKKTKKKDEDLDEKLAAKISALGGEKGVDIATLLASEDSDSSSSSEKKSHKKKKKRNKKVKKEKKKKRARSEASSSSDGEKKKKRKSKEQRKRVKDAGSGYTDSRKRRSDDSSDDELKIKRQREDHSSSSRADVHRGDRRRDEEYRSTERTKSMTWNRNERSDRERKTGRVEMSEAERAAKLAAMAAAGADRERERARRVADQRKAEASSTNSSAPRRAPEARMLPDSLESRIHSNRHYIQRDRRHMDEHFARR